jgi:photosystem II stability/assembly factor-like uncharacterized protein
MPLPLRIALFPALGALLLAPPPASASVLFQFGPAADYTEPLDPADSTIALRSGNLPFRSPSGAVQSSGWRAFSGGPLTPAAPYAGPALHGGYSVSYLERSDTAPTLFVGYGTTSSTATTGTYFQTGLRHDRPFNHLSPPLADALVLNAGYSGNASASGALLAEVAFLVGARFEAAASLAGLSADVRLPAGSTARAVVRQGSVFYVSEHALPVTVGTGQTLAWSSADLAATSWSLYDPDKPAPGTSPGVYHGVNYVSSSPRRLAALDAVTFAGVLLTRPFSASSFASSSFAELQLASLRVEGSPTPLPDGAWQRVGLPPGGSNSINPSGARQVFAVEIDGERDLLYAGNRFVGSGEGSVLRSADEGLTWQAVGVSTGESWNLAGSGPNEEGFRLHPLHPDTWLFASENRGVYATFDAGTTWQNVIPGWVSGGIGHGFEFQFHPGNPDRIWAAGGVGVFRSDDGGRTWINRSSGMNNSQTQALRVDPATPSRLYAGQIWTSGGLFRSDDGGDSWTRIENGIGEPGQRITPSGYFFVSTFQIELHPSRPGELHALTAKGLYRSTNYGDSWSPLAFIGASGVGTAIRSFKLHPREPDTVLAGATNGRVFLSLDGGAGWSEITGSLATGPMPAGEFMISVTELRFDPRDDAVVYAARTEGLYRYRLPRPPAPPRSLAVSPDAAPGGPRLSWRHPGFVVDRFVVETSPDGLAWSPLATLPGSARSLSLDTHPPGLARRYRVRAENTHGASVHSAPLEWARPLSLAAWRAASFTPGELANPALEAARWGDLAAPAGDSLPNLLKYHLGLPPLHPAPSPLALLPAAADDDGRIAVRHQRARAAPDAEAWIEWSADLHAWSRDHLAETVLRRTETHEEVETTLAIEPRPPRVFLRLRVQRAG